MSGINDPREEEVKPIEPLFDIDNDGDNDPEYLLLFMALLSSFHAEYKTKSPEYIYKNIDGRASQLLLDFESIIGFKLPNEYQKGLTSTVNDLKTVLKGQVPKESMNKSIDSILENTNKGKEISKILDYELTEQKLTARGIVTELQNDLKTSAYYIKNRLNKEPQAKIKLGNIVNTAVQRTKKMASHGSRSAFNNARDSVFQQAFGNDYMVDWISSRDARVCPFCRYFDANSPWRYSEVAPCPYHVKCRCETKPAMGAKLSDAMNVILRRDVF